MLKSKTYNAWYLKHVYKFGIECQKTIEVALQFDKCNGNTIWADAIAKEMRNV